MTLAVLPPFGRAEKERRERALRRGRALTEIVRCHYENKDLPSRKILHAIIVDRYHVKLKSGTLATDVQWLEQEDWIKRDGNEILLKKRDYELLADSWCVRSLLNAAALTDDNHKFALKEWRTRCEEMFKTAHEIISPDRAVQKYEEFLEELGDCGYIPRETRITDTSAQFERSQWNKDWFYLEIAKDANLRRTFKIRKRAPWRRDPN